MLGGLLFTALGRSQPHKVPCPTDYLLLQYWFYYADYLCLARLIS